MGQKPTPLSLSDQLPESAKAYLRRHLRSALDQVVDLLLRLQDVDTVRDLARDVNAYDALLRTVSAVETHVAGKVYRTGQRHLPTRMTTHQKALIALGLLGYELDDLEALVADLGEQTIAFRDHPLPDSESDS